MRCYLFLLVAGVCLLVCVMAAKSPNENDLSSKLSNVQMMNIWGGDSQGCQSDTDTTSCVTTNTPFFTRLCTKAIAKTIREQEDDETDEEYQAFKNQEMPICSYDPSSKVGSGVSFQTAKTGGDKTKKVADNGVERCLNGYYCKNNGSPSGGMKSESTVINGNNTTKCVASDNPNSYCVDCTADSRRDLPDSDQPKKKKCVDDE